MTPRGRRAAPRLALCLGPDATVEADGAATVIRHQFGSVTVAGPPWLAAVVARLAEDELDADAVLDVLIDEGIDDGDGLAVALAELDAVLAMLPMVLHRVVYDGDDELVRLVPTATTAPAASVRELAGTSFITLDRHAYLRRVPDRPGLSLESPLAHHRAQLSARLVALLGEASSGLLTVVDVDDPSLRVAVALLDSVGLLHVGPTVLPEADETPWSFHDLAFHARSRQGRTDEAFGALSEDAQPHEPPRAEVPDRAASGFVDLAVPTYDDVLAADPRLTEVLERRRSVRDYGERPITVASLGELLYRTARVRAIRPVPFHEGYDGIDRPYPTGGMAGDLEVYVTAARCEGLEEGAYHYDAQGHRLEPVATIDDAQPLLHAATVAAGFELDPQVLLTFTSRFERTSWKYGSIAYALTLKHVGVLIQTIYLVATAMGLASCALGSGDADAAATVFGLDYLSESSVGEMVLGSLPEPLPAVTSFTDLRARRAAE